MNAKILSGMLIFLTFICCGASQKKTQQEVDQAFDYKEAVQNYQIGCNYLNDNDSVNAINYLEKALHAEPENYRFNHWLGVAYAMNGQFDQAETYLTRAIEINPESTESHNYLATMYTDLGRFEEAEENLRKVLADESYPQPDFAYFNLGILKQAEGKPLEAVAAFNKCVKINPKFYRAYYTLGNMYEEDENYKGALHYYSRAEPGYPDDYTLFFKIGKMNFKLKRYQEAKRYFSQVTILFPPPEIDKATQDMMSAITKLGY